MCICVYTEINLSFENVILSKINSIFVIDAMSVCVCALVVEAYVCLPYSVSISIKMV